MGPSLAVPPLRVEKEGSGDLPIQARSAAAMAAAVNYCIFLRYEYTFSYEIVVWEQWPKESVTINTDPPKNGPPYSRDAKEGF